MSSLPERSVILTEEEAWKIAAVIAEPKSNVNGNYGYGVHLVIEGDRGILTGNPDSILLWLNKIKPRLPSNAN